MTKVISPGAQDKAGCNGSSDDISDEHHDGGDSGINGVVSATAIVRVILVFFFSSQWDGKERTSSSVSVCSFLFPLPLERGSNKGTLPLFPLSTLLTDFRVKADLILFLKEMEIAPREDIRAPNHGHKITIARTKT